MDLKQGLRPGHAERFNVRGEIDLCHFEKHLAGQRVAVGMQAGRGQADEQVSCCNLAAVDDAVAVDRSDDGPGQVILPGGVKSRHFGGFASNQGAAVLPAGIGHPPHQGGCCGGIKHADAEVIEEEQGISPAGHDVVDAVVDQVLADRLMASGGEGNLEFGADPIDAGNDDRIAVFFQIEGKKAGEKPDLPEHLAVKGRFGQSRNLMGRLFRRLEVDPSRLIGDGH